MASLVGKLRQPSTVFLACDLQERFRELIWHMPSVISTARFLVDASSLLNVHCVATEQYPKGLLHTVPELNIGTAPDQHEIPVFEKQLFSMWTGEVKAHIEGLKAPATDFVLFGIEAHVCVTQTCLDLIEEGHRVHVVCDGVSSQKPFDRAVALQRMQKAGAFLTTAEQVVLQLLHSADHPSFKAVSSLVKQRSKDGENAFLSMASL